MVCCLKFNPDWTSRSCRKRFPQHMLFPILGFSIFDRKRGKMVPVQLKSKIGTALFSPCLFTVFTLYSTSFHEMSKTNATEVFFFRKFAWSLLKTNKIAWTKEPVKLILRKKTLISRQQKERLTTRKWNIHFFSLKYLDDVGVTTEDCRGTAKILDAQRFFLLRCKKPNMKVHKSALTAKCRLKFLKDGCIHHNLLAAVHSPKFVNVNLLWHCPFVMMLLCCKTANILQ